MDTKVLKILSDNARCSVEEIATMAGMSEADVLKNIAELEAAVKVLVVCVKIAALEKLINQ